LDLGGAESVPCPLPCSLGLWTFPFSLRPSDGPFLRTPGKVDCFGLWMPVVRPAPCRDCRRTAVPLLDGPTDTPQMIKEFLCSKEVLSEVPDTTVEIALPLGAIPSVHVFPPPIVREGFTPPPDPHVAVQSFHGNRSIPLSIEDEIL